MFGSEVCGFSFWWIVPITMMFLCFIMMRGRRGSMMCGFGSRHKDRNTDKAGYSARDILDRRYASGEIDRVEYEEKKRALIGSTGQIEIE